MASTAAPVRLVESQTNAAAVVLLRAFQEDVSTAYMIPEMVTRSRGLPFLFAPLVRYTLANGEAYTTEGADAVALWLPPGNTTPTNEGMSQAGIGDAVQELGDAAMGRVMNLSSYLEIIHAREMPGPHWRLFFLGVEPERQGQGVGGALIQPMLMRIAEAGVPIYLDTLEARTVPFYERQGFRVVAEGDVPDSAVHVWAMRRDPTA